MMILFKKKHKWLTIKGINNQIDCPVCKDNQFIKTGKLIVRGNNNRVVLGSPNKLEGGSLTVLGNNNKVQIGKECYCWFDIQVVGNNCEVIIGEHNGFKDCAIRLNEDNTKIIIGNDGMFAQGTRITCTDFHAILDYETKKPVNPGKEIIIGSHVWATVDVKIMKNTHISDDVIIGAGAIVTKDLSEAHAVYAGCPAKLVKKGLTWSSDTYNHAMQKYNLSLKE